LDTVPDILYGSGAVLPTVVQDMISYRNKKIQKSQEENKLKKEVRKDKKERNEDIYYLS
jgi:hypothetical protein